MNHSMATICGGVALQAGFLVAFKQLVPEHTVTIAKGLIQIRVKVQNPPPSCPPSIASLRD